MSKRSRYGSLVKEKPKTPKVLTKRNVKILKDYRNGQLAVTDIAEKYAVSPGLITLIAKNAHVKLRGRGRKRQAEPSPKVKRILQTAQSKSLVDTGNQYAVSKQFVWLAIRRWASWKGAKGE